METSKEKELRITPSLKKEIIKIVDERIREAHVTKEYFSELKNIVKELAEAQKRTEERLDQLTIRVNELAEAQKRTEEEIRKLAIGLKNICNGVGELAKALIYTFENEAFRMLPRTLKEKYGIEITERFVRAEIGEHEINILSLGRRDGKEVVVVGEAKTRLERMEVFDELEDKVKAVKEEYKDREIVKVLVTHFATGKILKFAKDTGVIVVQSFEWISP